MVKKRQEFVRSFQRFPVDRGNSLAEYTSRPSVATQKL